MVDAADLKSASRERVWVRIPPSALFLVRNLSTSEPATGRLMPENSLSFTISIFSVLGPSGENQRVKPLQGGLFHALHDV